MKFLKTLFWVGLAIQLAMTSAKAQSVSDSLVDNLSCKKINNQSIHAAIRDDAFSVHKQLPMTNWNFAKGGVIPLGNCWSLTHSQRLFYYLGRFNGGPIKSEKTIEGILNMVRGSRPTVPRKTKIKEYFVFPIEDEDFYGRSAFLEDLNRGINNYSRTIRSEIEAYQFDRFNNPSNMKMIFKGGARSERKNVETYNTLIDNLNHKKLTNVVIRISRSIQHVILFKSYRKTRSGVVEFTVYDSNQPYSESIVNYLPNQKEFTSPDVAQYFLRHLQKDSHSPLGLFIVDEDEFEMIDDALVSYYSKKCGALKANMLSEKAAKNYSRKLKNKQPLKVKVSAKE